MFQCTMLNIHRCSHMQKLMAIREFFLKL